MFAARVGGFSGIGPSCSGRAHRRCLLTEEQCECPCHRDELVEQSAVVVPPVFPCAICFESFGDEIQRAIHFTEAHTVDLADRTIELDEETLEAPLLPMREDGDDDVVDRRRYACPYCSKAYKTRGNCAWHIVDTHARAAASVP